MKINFRCPSNLIGKIPTPSLAKFSMPDWWSAMERTVQSRKSEVEIPTVKQCMPFLDALTHGMILPLVADIFVKDGQFSWEWEWEVGESCGLHIPKEPMGFHEDNQIPAFQNAKESTRVVKFHNFWTIKTEPGYSLLILHPMNRLDLPFTTFAGMVDSDVYSDAFVQIPALWTDSDFSGMLPKGTPIAQLVPVRRERIELSLEMLKGQSKHRFSETVKKIATTTGEYRRNYRCDK